MGKPSGNDFSSKPRVPASGATNGGPGQSQPVRLATGMLAVAIGAAAFICMYLLVTGAHEPEPLIIPQHQPQTMQVDGKSPDTYGRPPGDPHYGHPHP